MASYALDLRKRILQACDQGGTIKAVATRFAVSDAVVRALQRRRRTTGQIEALPRHAGPKPKLKAYEDTLRGLRASQPDATLEA